MTDKLTPEEIKAIDSEASFFRGAPYWGVKTKDTTLK